MTRLTDVDREAFARLTESGWIEAPALRSPTIVAPTTAARELYCHWATQASRFYQGKKPVRFGGEHWKL